MSTVGLFLNPLAKVLTWAVTAAAGRMNSKGEKSKTLGRCGGVDTHSCKSIFSTLEEMSRKACYQNQEYGLL